jgi:hypothetical protein
MPRISPPERDGESIFRTGFLLAMTQLVHHPAITVARVGLWEGEMPVLSMLLHRVAC